jgi:hypothetical protein
MTSLIEIRGDGNWPWCGESEVHGKTTADPSTSFAAENAANFAQDDNSM